MLHRNLNLAFDGGDGQKDQHSKLNHYLFSKYYLHVSLKLQLAFPGTNFCLQTLRIFIPLVYWYRFKYPVFKYLVFKSLCYRLILQPYLGLNLLTSLSSTNTIYPLFVNRFTALNICIFWRRWCHSLEFFIFLPFCVIYKSWLLFI